jgi:hypothetical protein
MGCRVYTQYRCGSTESVVFQQAIPSQHHGLAMQEPSAEATSSWSARAATIRGWLDCLQVWGFDDLEVPNVPAPFLAVIARSMMY